MNQTEDKIKSPVTDEVLSPERPDGVYTYGIIPKKENYDKYCKALGVEKLPIVVNVYTFDNECSARNDSKFDAIGYAKDNLARSAKQALKPGSGPGQEKPPAYLGEVPVLGICIDEAKYNGKIDKKDPRYAFVDGINAAIADFKKECMKDGIDVDFKVVMTGYSAGATTAQAFTMARPDCVSLSIMGGGTSLVPLKSDRCGEVYGTQDMFPEQKSAYANVAKIYVRGEHEYDVLANPDGTISKTPEDHELSVSVKSGENRSQVIHDMGDRGPGRPVTGSDEGLANYYNVLGEVYLEENPDASVKDMYNPSFRDVGAIKHNVGKGDNTCLIIVEGGYHNPYEAMKVGGLSEKEAFKKNVGMSYLNELGRAYEEYAVKGKRLEYDVINIDYDKDNKKELVDKDLKNNYDQITGWWALDEEHQKYADMADEMDLLKF